jgi:hypothetical protein
LNVPDKDELLEKNNLTVSKAIIWRIHWQSFSSLKEQTKDCNDEWKKWEQNIRW